jgi:peroxiredoxin
MRPGTLFWKLNVSLSVFAALAIAATSLAAIGQDTTPVPGLQPGVKAPAIALRDQAGKERDFRSLAGPNGLLLLFFRSADWCPFCKGQLVDLEGAQKAFAAKGIGVAGVSYDSTAILADFSRRRSIRYPLLSDPSSTLIDAFGIRNPAGTGMQAGIPYPGFYLIDASGTIQKRFFESGFINRMTANNLYENLFGGVAIPAAAHVLESTPHVTVTTAQSDLEVTPGAVIRLDVTLLPGPDTHVYAPGAEEFQYRVVTLKIEPSDLYSVSATDYPRSEKMNFPDLKQVVPVYTGKTLLTATVAAQVNGKTMPIFAHNPQLQVKGELAYQACTSAVCFPPVKAAVEWNVKLRQLDRERVPDAIQHK